EGDCRIGALELVVRPDDSARRASGRSAAGGPATRCATGGSGAFRLARGAATVAVVDVAVIALFARLDDGVAARSRNAGVQTRIRIHGVPVVAGFSGIRH